MPMLQALKCTDLISQEEFANQANADKSNMLKNVLPMERIVGLLSYINGNLDDESDDIIDDSQLYFMFVRLAAQSNRMNTPQGRDGCIAREMATYREPVPGAGARVEKVLSVMLTAWASAQLRQAAEAMLQQMT